MYISGSLRREELTTSAREQLTIAKVIELLSANGRTESQKEH